MEDAADDADCCLDWSYNWKKEGEEGAALGIPDDDDGDTWRRRWSFMLGATTLLDDANGWAAANAYTGEMDEQW